MSDNVKELSKQLNEIREKLRAAQRGAAEPVGEYAFATPDGKVELANLFGDRQDLLFIHNMGKSCPYCTLWADGFNGLANHLSDRAAFVLGSPDTPKVQREFADSRGWRFRMVSYGKGTFAQDMGYESEKPNQYGRFMPGVSAFHKIDDGTIIRTGHTYFGPFDEFCSVWQLFDLLNDGVNEWSPKFEYA